MLYLLHTYINNIILYSNTEFQKTNDNDIDKDCFKIAAKLILINILKFNLR